MYVCQYAERICREMDFDFHKGSITEIRKQRVQELEAEVLSSTLQFSETVFSCMPPPLPRKSLSPPPPPPRSSPPKSPSPPPPPPPCTYEEWRENTKKQMRLEMIAEIAEKRLVVQPKQFEDKDERKSMEHPFPICQGGSCFIQNQLMKMKRTRVTETGEEE